jgi:hypothetical protein
MTSRQRRRQILLRAAENCMHTKVMHLPEILREASNKGDGEYRYELARDFPKVFDDDSYFPPLFYTRDEMALALLFLRELI